MPVYEYICEDCGTHFDVRRAMKDADQPTACKTCNGDHTRRLLSRFFSKNDGKSGGSSSPSGGGGCSGCAGGSCGSCHH